MQRYYIASSRELTRLSSITKAPILHHFSETISGIMTLRCFRKEDHFFKGNVERVNANLRMDFHSNASNEWLGLRLEFIGSILICIATIFMVLLPRFLISPGEILKSPFSWSWLHFRFATWLILFLSVIRIHRLGTVLWTASKWCALLDGIHELYG